MDELVKLVSQKTGLSEQMAKTAVETVIGFLKDKLPKHLIVTLAMMLTGLFLGRHVQLWQIGVI